jgi:hypothetical protein
MHQQYIKRTAYDLAIQAVKDALQTGELLGEFDATRAAAIEQEIMTLLDQLGAARDKL